MKRAFSLIMALVMVLTVFPVTALAATETVKIFGITLVSGTYYKTKTQSGSTSLTEEGAGSSDYNVFYDADSHSLHLRSISTENFTLGSYSEFIRIDSSNDFSVYVEGSNTVTNNYMNSFLSFYGNGTNTLTVRGGGSLSSAPGIYGFYVYDADASVTGVTLNLSHKANNGGSGKHRGRRRTGNHRNRIGHRCRRLCRNGD